MRKELIWSLPGLYREDMEVYGYHFALQQALLRDK